MLFVYVDGAEANVRHYYVTQNNLMVNDQDVSVLGEGMWKYAKKNQRSLCAVLWQKVRRNDIGPVVASHMLRNKTTAAWVDRTVQRKLCRLCGTRGEDFGIDSDVCAECVKSVTSKRQEACPNCDVARDGANIECFHGTKCCEVAQDGAIDVLQEERLLTLHCGHHMCEACLVEAIHAKNFDMEGLNLTDNEIANMLNLDCMMPKCPSKVKFKTIQAHNNFLATKLMEKFTAAYRKFQSDPYEAKVNARMETLASVQQRLIGADEEDFEIERLAIGYMDDHYFDKCPNPQCQVNQDVYNPACMKLECEKCHTNYCGWCFTFSGTVPEVYDHIRKCDLNDQNRNEFGKTDYSVVFGRRALARAYSFFVQGTIPERLRHRIMNHNKVKPYLLEAGLYDTIHDWM